MSEAINEAELGRSKKIVDPADHLRHLLGLGWSPSAPLIEKYVLKNRLNAQLIEWQALNMEVMSNNQAKSKKSKA